MISYKRFGQDLLNWSQENVRVLPWLAEKNPYKIWISEIMLQQTRVDQVIPFYKNFIAKYPTISRLAKSNVDDVLLNWEGLGYYTRARNIHKTAQIVVHQFKGIFPREIDSIKSLPGIGDYTSAAIASFAYDYPIAAVDGNVVRILARVFGLDEIPINAIIKKKYQLLAQNCLGDLPSAKFNQAMMDMGSQLCTPKNPSCKHCPFKHDCVAYMKDMIDLYPVRKNKIQKTERSLHYILPIDPDGNSLIKLRNNKDIWHGLQEFVLIENKSKYWLRKEQIQQELDTIIRKNELLSIQKQKVIHVLSHQLLNIFFYKVILSRKIILKNKSTYRVESVKNFLNFAFPRALRLYLSNTFIKN